MTEATEAPASSAEDDWDTSPRVPSIPVLHLEGFDGPMDLLLDLAERQRIDLGRMSVQALVEQFVAAMERLVGRVALELRADWLVLATRLVLLRSRLLFPASPEEVVTAERDATAELRRLDTMTFMRAVASWLEARPQLGIDVFLRPAPELPRPQGGYVALMEACLVVLDGRTERSGEAELVYRPAIPDLWRVPDALARIRASLSEHPEGGELSHFLPPTPSDDAQRPLKARSAVASTFVAALELAKEGTIDLTQQTRGATIHLRSSSVPATKPS